jgi:hypothetical protein
MGDNSSTSNLLGGNSSPLHDGPSHAYKGQITTKKSMMNA